MFDVSALEKVLKRKFMSTIPVRKRTENGTRACKKLRKTGEVPGVIYGNKKENVLVSMPLNTILPLLKDKTQALKLTYDQQEEEVTIRDIQRDFLLDIILHIDFCRIQPKQS